MTASPSGRLRLESRWTVRVKEKALRTGNLLELGNVRFSFFREEFADHGRPFGGRQGGEFSHQREQPPRPSG